MVKIVSSESIWATEVRYLNDATEFEYGRQVLTKGFEGYEWLETLLSQYSLEGTKPHVFVFSMSDSDDSLSQWRSYCPPGTGCSIGFDYSAIQHLPDESFLASRFSLYQCVYTEQEQMALIRRVIEDYLELSRSNHPSRTGTIVPYAIETILARLKHPSFSEECEWRFVHYREEYLPVDKEQSIQHRMGKSMLVPYLEVPLKPIPISEIKIGPCPHPALSRTSVESLLATRKLSARITHSQIPYRAW